MSSATMIAMLAGAAISAVGAIQQGKAASDAANFNAQVANNNAIASRASAAESAKRQGRLGRKHMATVRLNDVSGDVIADEATEVELSIQDVLHQGELAALGFSTSASLSRAKAKNAKTAGYIGAASTLLAGTANSGVFDAKTTAPKSTQIRPHS